MTITTPSPSTSNAERRRLHHEAEVVIVGAGVFGCAIAVTLARQGRSVILLEKSLKEPDRIVGELLQPGGVAALKKLGLENCCDGIDAIRVFGYDVVYYGKEVLIPYPNLEDRKRIPAPEGKYMNGHANGHANGSAVKGEKKQSSGRPEGRCFHHGRFINNLRKACKAEPNITIFETTVTQAITTQHSPQVLGVESQTLNPKTGEKEKDYYFAELTIIADGYNSLFRKTYMPTKKPLVKSKFYALELQDAVLPAPNHGIVVLSQNHPVLLYQIGTNETRALIDIPDNLPTASVAAGGVKSHLRDIVLPSLPPSVQPSFAAALSDPKLRSMPNSFLPPTTQDHTPGLIILGDAMNMRHPLTGGGMTVAFNDVVLLSSLLAPSQIPSFSNTSHVQSVMRTFHWRRKDLASIVNILSMALYALFAADDPQLQVLQRGCFEYFRKGGDCLDRPAGLLAGIIRRPGVLVYHFFAVAGLGMWILMGEVVGNVWGVWKAPYAVVMAIRVFWKACVVIFPFIWSEMRG